MAVESHQKLKAAFIAGRLDASLAADPGRMPIQEQRSMETLLTMVLGDADLHEVAELCQVLFHKQEDPGTSLDLVVRAVDQDELAVSAALRKPGNGNGGDRR